MTSSSPGNSALDVVRRVGTASWSLIGLVLVLTMALTALAAVSEVVLPLVFATVLAVVFTPACDTIARRGLPRPLAALLVVVLVLAVSIGTIAFAAVAVAQQMDTWSGHVGAAIGELAPTSDAVGLDREALERVREAAGGIAGIIAGGLVTAVVSGVDTVVGFVAGAILGILILYYLLKDGARLRQRAVGRAPEPLRAEVNALIGRSATTVRSYAAGRAALSAIVAAVIALWSAIVGLPMLAAIALVNFIGGFVPYVGGVVGGGVAVILALSEGGIGLAGATLAVVLAANFALENLVEPQLLGARLRLHPLLVLVATAVGGIVGGVVGLILAVPLFLIGSDAVRTAWRRTGAAEAP